MTFATTSGTPGAGPLSPLLVALDLDGTTIDHVGALSSAVRDAVSDVVDAGHHLVISTGRSIVATLPIVEMLGLERGYAVCSNGAVTLVLDPERPSGYRIVDTVTFDPRPVLTMLRDVIPNALVAVEDLGVGFKVSGPFPDGELGGEQVVVDWEELVAHPATRVTLRRPEASSEEFMEQVEHAGLHGVSYAVGWTAWLDINPEASRRVRLWSWCAARSGWSRVTPSPSATSATTSRCCTGPRGVWPWVRRPTRSRTRPTRSRAPSRRTASSPCCARCCEPGGGVLRVARWATWVRGLA